MLFDLDVPFPNNYRKVVQMMFRRLFRIYIHVYYSHFSLLRSMNLESQFYFSLKHYLHFMDEFDIVKPAYLYPLQEVIFNLTPELKSRGNEKDDHNNE